MIGVQIKIFYIERNNLGASLGGPGRMVISGNPSPTRLLYICNCFYAEVVKCMRCE